MTEIILSILCTVFCVIVLCKGIETSKRISNTICEFCDVKVMDEKEKKTKNNIDEKEKAILKSKQNICNYFFMVCCIAFILFLLPALQNVDYASKQNDGWLLLLILICMLVFSFLNLTSEIKIYSIKKKLDFSKNKKNMLKLLENKEEENYKITERVVSIIFVIGSILIICL